MHKLSMHKYLDKLFSHESDPGGGVATAFTGAQAAALLSMVGNISSRRDPEKCGDLGINEKLKELDEIREKLMKLATEDANAFGKVRQGYKMPNSTAAEKKARAEYMQVSLKGAAEAPLDVMRTVARMYDIAEVMVEVSGVALVTDIGIAVLLMDASMYSSNFNVKINIKYVKDSKLKENLATEVHQLIRDKRGRKEALISRIKAMMQ